MSRNQFTVTHIQLGDPFHMTRPLSSSAYTSVKGTDRGKVISPRCNYPNLLCCTLLWKRGPRRSDFHIRPLWSDSQSVCFDFRVKLTRCAQSPLMNFAVACMPACAARATVADHLGSSNDLHWYYPARDQGKALCTQKEVERGSRKFVQSSYRNPNNLRHSLPDISPLGVPRSSPCQYLYIIWLGSLRVQQPPPSPRVSVSANLAEETPGKGRKKWLNDCNFVR